MANEFTYTYSAKDSSEAEKILKKYTAQPAAGSNMDTLRKLDASAATAGRIVSLTIGILGCLVFGTGMCCVMLWNMLAVGIALGIVGIAGICAAYPINKSITKKQREKIAPEIIRLSNEIMGK